MWYYASTLLVIATVAALFLFFTRSQSSRHQQRRNHRTNRYAYPPNPRSKRHPTERPANTRQIIYRSSYPNVISHPRFQRSYWLPFSSNSFRAFSSQRHGNGGAKQTGIVVPFRGGEIPIHVKDACNRNNRTDLRCKEDIE